MYNQLTNTRDTYLFVAIHRGPYLSIEPIEEALLPSKVLYLADGVSKSIRESHGLPYLTLDAITRSWGSLETFLSSGNIKAIVRGSSEEDDMFNVENLASAAATNVGLPVFVIEDYPGNYWKPLAHRVDGLFVEPQQDLDVHLVRGLDPEVVYPMGNPRYSKLLSVDVNQFRTGIRETLGLSKNQPVFLWAGQPDNKNSYMTLDRVLANFRPNAPDVVLLFRSHPRDEYYLSGIYQTLLDKVDVRTIDVSDYEDPIQLYCGVDLVVTQFSSAAIEASYLGIPAVFVLFEDLGKQHLELAKGYGLPPWCHGGSSFLIESEEQIASIMEEGLFDKISRERVLNNFDRFFNPNKDVANQISGCIKTIINSEHISRR